MLHFITHLYIFTVKLSKHSALDRTLPWKFLPREFRLEYVTKRVSEFYALKKYNSSDSKSYEMNNLMVSNTKSRKYQYHADCIGTILFYVKIFSDKGNIYQIINI